MGEVVPFPKPMRVNDYDAEDVTPAPSAHDRMCDWVVEFAAKLRQGLYLGRPAMIYIAMQTVDQHGHVAYPATFMYADPADQGPVLLKGLLSHHITELNLLDENEFDGASPEPPQDAA